MIISIDLKNFRSYEGSSFEFEPGVNIIVGPNASGKTNIIESILLASSGSTYRGRDINLIMHSKDWSRIELVSQQNSRVLKLQKEGEKIKRSIVLDEVKKARLPKDKVIHSVLFEPNHLQMFHGGPEMRREFMDNILSVLYPEFALARKHYKRALQQRNGLLKSGMADKESLFIWNLRLSDLGGVIAKYRLEMIDELNRQLPSIYKSLSGTAAEISVLYVSKNRVGSYASDMLKNLEKNLDIDLARKHTTTGPHRDDMEITIDEHNVKDVASRGEVRTIILACKVFEVLQLEKCLGIKPIILLDDVFSELDGSRRQALTSFLEDSQVFITTTDADVVIQHFLQKCHVLALG